MSTAEKVIKRQWITAGGGALWDTEGTYSAVAYDRLPSLLLSSSNLDLLSLLPERDYGCTLDNDDNRITGFSKLDASLRALGFTFPENFSRFITRPDLQVRVPSCTGCFLELSDAVTPLPGYPGHYVVRFMNDSQACVLWYLLFQPASPTRVLATSCFVERDAFEAMEYEQDADESTSYNAVLKDACICADSFTDFICRFCIENAIWFALRENLPLAPLEISYLQAIDRKV